MISLPTLRRALIGGVLLALAGSPPALCADYSKIFETVSSRVDNDFYDPAFHGEDWHSIVARYRRQLIGVKDDLAFSELIREMLGQLHVSHTYLVPPSTSDARQVGVGMDVLEINGLRYVENISTLSDAHRAGLRVGDELQGPREALYGEAGSTAQIQVQSCDGMKRTFQVERGSRLGPAEHPGWRWSRFSFGGHRTIGYIRVDRFDDGAAALADQAMSDLKDSDGLIIDLRKNSGGNNSALRLASYFMPAGEAPIYALLARPFLKALGHEPTASDVLQGPKIVGAYTDAQVFKAVSDHKGAAVFYTEALGGERYKRPVVVLISGNTGSAAEGFAWAMRLHSNATFIGHTSAGALLSGEEFPVGDGWTLTIPVQGLWAPDGRDFIDRAVSPDIATTWTRNDLCSGHDPDVQRASDLLNKK